MNVVDVQQRTPEWHQWRRRGVSATATPVLTGRSKYDTPWGLWAKTVGLIPEPDLSKNPNVQRGIQLEPEARNKLEWLLTQPWAWAESPFEQGLPLTPGDYDLLPVCAESDVDPLIRASLDGLVGDIPFEIKCPSQGVFETVEEEGLEGDQGRMYWAQVQHQLLVTGGSHGLLFFYRDDTTYQTFVVERDEQFIEQELLPAAREFWEHVQTGTEPDKDPDRDSWTPEGDDLFRWTEASNRYKEKHRRIRDLEAELKELKSSIKDDEQRLEGLMGSWATAEADGLRVKRGFRRGSVDWRGVAEELAPDGVDEEIQERHRREGSAQVTVTVTGEKKGQKKPRKSSAPDTTTGEPATQEADAESVLDFEWFF